MRHIDINLLYTPAQGCLDLLLTWLFIWTPSLPFSLSYYKKKCLSYILFTVLRMCSFTLSPLLIKFPPLISSSLLAKITCKFLFCLWILTPPWKSDSLTTPTTCFYSWQCFLFLSISDCKLPRVKDYNLFINVWQDDSIVYCDMVYSTYI